MSAKLLEVLRSRYESTLVVLSARIACAKDEDDWATIEIQTRELQRIAKHARGILLREFLKKEGL